MGREIEPTLTNRSISFLVAFRDLVSNDLAEMPSGTFDSLVSLTSLYVLSLVAETSFVLSLPPSLLELDILVLFLRSPWPNEIPLLYK